jgi:hypothetical protein
MMHLRRSWAFATAAVAVAALLALGPPVRADFSVTLTVGANSETFTGSQNSLSANNVSFGGYNISFVAASNNTPGNATYGEMNLTSLTVNNASAGSSPLTITEFASDFTSPQVNPLYFQGQISGVGQAPTGTTLSSTTTATGNGAGGTTVTTPTITMTNWANGVNSDWEAFSPGTSPGNNYSLTQVYTLSGLGQGSNVSFDGESIASVPAPASLALWLSGLPVLGLARLWRRRQQGPLAIA